MHRPGITPGIAPEFVPSSVPARWPTMRDRRTHGAADQGDIPGLPIVKVTPCSPEAAPRQAVNGPRPRACSASAIAMSPAARADGLLRGDGGDEIRCPKPRRNLSFYG